MALRASENKEWKQLSTTYRFFKRCAGHCQTKSVKKHPKMEPKWTRNPSKWRLRRPSELLGAHFGYRAYFETLSGAMFRGFGLPWGSLGESSGTLWGGLFETFSFREGPEPENGRFLGDLSSDAFFTRVSMDFGGVPDGKTMDSV